MNTIHGKYFQSSYMGGMSRRVRKQSLKSGGGRRFRKEVPRLRTFSTPSVPFGAADFNASGSCRPPKGFVGLRIFEFRLSDLQICRFSNLQISDAQIVRFSDCQILRFPHLQISRFPVFRSSNFQIF